MGNEKIQFYIITHALLEVNPIMIHKELVTAQGHHIVSY